MLSLSRMISRFMRRKRFLPVLLLLLFTPLLSACDEGAAEIAVEMALEWATEKKLITYDDEGNLTVNLIQIGIYEGSRRWFGSTGDSQLDAALEIGGLARDIQQADALAAQGMAAGDPELLDRAIEMRPGDWSYYDQKAAILAAQGRADEAREASAQADALVAGRIRADEPDSCRALQQNLLRNRENALLQQLENDPDNPHLLEILMDTQDTRYQLETNGAGSPCP